MVAVTREYGSKPKTKPLPKGKGLFFCLKYRKARALGGNAGLLQMLRMSITCYAYP
ncbi:hypothetical protein bas27_0086 [Escherichia phage TrudiGerster]|uniref:Uncharacterized protein n=1 Tax=Escherichia phage TrudiGerster TaxID=2851991 RepID=A0AAE8B8E0_9CAUD|nr:hypothetical protein bas27_0086 [Escherichia phage TrudiGerster]